MPHQTVGIGRHCGATPSPRACARMGPFVGWAKAPARNADATKAIAWRRAHVSVESVNTGLTRGHGARAVDRDCGSVWAGAPLPTLRRIYLIEPSFSAVNLKFLGATA